MSSEKQAEKEEKNMVETGTVENRTSKLVLVTNGSTKDFPNSSAAQLLKTIVIASQAAGQPQLSAKTTMQTTENPVQVDMFRTRNANTIHCSGQQQSAIEQQGSEYIIQGMQGIEGANSNFQNGMNAQLLQELAKVSKESKSLTEALQINTDQSNGILSGNLNQSDHLATYEGLKGHGQQSPDCSISKNGVLQRLLSGDNTVTGTPRNLGMASPTVSPPNSSADSQYGTDSNFSPFTETTQGSVFMDAELQGSGLKDFGVTLSDTTTQSSLIVNTGNLRLDTMAVENNLDGDVKYDLTCEWNVTKLEDNLDRAKTGKVPRLHQDSDASSALSPSVDNVFRAENAQQEVPSDFTFQLFGQGDGEQVFPINSENDLMPSIDSPVLPGVVDQPFKTPLAVPHSVVKQQRERLRRSKEPILSQPFPAKLHGYELRILQQPEEQHRARYLTEGSRGAVKNRGGTGFPQVKLFGYTGQATLQVFIGNDSGRVRPHGFYQACKVCGKNSTMCTEKDIDGTTVIEIELQAANDMTASIDCVGILKLRNADVEQRIGIAKAKKKSTKARMIFRVTFQKPCGSPQVLQVASSTILCTQPIGQPEICKMSLKEVTLIGGDELYIIGKNFLRGTRVFFQRVSEDNPDQIIWEKEGELDKDYFQTTHMIATVPEYTGAAFVGTRVTCQVVANSGGKVSEPQPFIYKTVDPASVTIKPDITDTVEESRKRNYPFVAPEALELNQQIQQTQQVSSSSDMFQLPRGILSGIPETERFTPMEQESGDGKQGRGQSQEENTTNKLDIQASVSNNNLSMKGNTFGSENLDLSPTQTWATKETSELFNAFDKSDSSLELGNMNFTSMNTDEYDDNSLDPAYMRIKSPRLSNDDFCSNQSEQIGMGNSTNIRSEGSSIVSQFLQNISMALKHSDPMFSGTETLISKPVSAQSTTVLTTVNSHAVMSSNMGKTTAISESIASDKPQPMEHSFLKEALTCPPENLTLPSFSKIQSYTDQGQSGNFAATSEASRVVDMQTNVDQNFCANNEGLRSEHEKIANNSESMEMSPESNLISSSYPGTPHANPATPYAGSLASNTEASYPLDAASHVQSPATPYSFGQAQSPATPYSSAAGSQVLSPATPYSFGQGTQVNHPADLFSAQSPATPFSSDSAQQIVNPATPYSSSMASSQMHSPATPFSMNQVSHISNPSTPYSGGPTSSQAASYCYSESLSDTNRAPPPYSAAVSSQMLGVSSQMDGSPAYSLHQASQAANDFAFSVGDHDILTSLQINQSLGSEMKCIASLLGHHNIPHQGSLYHPAHTQTRESASHLKTIMSSVVQENTESSQSIQSQSGQQDQHMEHRTTQQGNPNKKQTNIGQSESSNIDSVLKQMLSGLPNQQQEISKVQQYQQQQQQQQQQMFSQQQQFSQHNQSIDHQQQQQASVFSLPSSQGSTVMLTQSNLLQLPGSASAPNPSQNPVAPQIIICNNPASQAQLPTSHFGAPSIVIVPGQNGQEFQVENLLRSILGSMMQTTPDQQQQQQQLPK